jgi:hypothetical protein
VPVDAICGHHPVEAEARLAIGRLSRVCPEPGSTSGAAKEQLDRCVYGLKEITAQSNRGDLTLIIHTPMKATIIVSTRTTGCHEMFQADADMATRSEPVPA